MRKRSIFRCSGPGVGAHSIYTEARSLEEACDLILNQKRKNIRGSRLKRDLKRSLNSSLGHALVSKKPVTLPQIVLPEIKWEK